MLLLIVVLYKICFFILQTILMILIMHTELSDDTFPKSMIENNIIFFSNTDKNGDCICMNIFIFTL